MLTETSIRSWGTGVGGKGRGKALSEPMWVTETSPQNMHLTSKPAQGQKKPLNVTVGNSDPNHCLTQVLEPA